MPRNTLSGEEFYIECAISALEEIGFSGYITWNRTSKNSLTFEWPSAYPDPTEKLAARAAAIYQIIFGGAEDNPNDEPA